MRMLCHSLMENLNTAVLRTHLQVEVHHNRFIVKARCEDFHFATGIIDPASHARVVIICRLHVVLCAIGRDQKDGSPASVECFIEFPDIIFCSGSHGLYLFSEALARKNPRRNLGGNFSDGIREADAFYRLPHTENGASARFLYAASLLDFLSGLFMPIRFSLDLYISYHPGPLQIRRHRDKN